MKKEINIPNGWTYFIHGTNTSKWKENINVLDHFSTTSELSCITEQDAKEEIQNGISTTKDYSSGKGKPFEIRCLIYKDCIRHQDVNNLKDRLSPNEIKRLAKYYFNNIFGGRHECVPRKTRLIKIGKSEKNELTGEEKDVLWFVPEEFYDRYLEDCEKYPDRQVELTTKDKPLPSWSLDGYNLSKEQVDRIRGVPENYNAIQEIKAFTQKEYSGAFETTSIVKLEDKDIVKKILLSQGIDPNANINVFLSQYEDKEQGGEVYQLLMRDRKGRVKEVKLPVSKGESQIVTDRKVMARNENGNIILSPGINKKSPLSWALPDGTELNVLLNKGDIQLAKTENGRTSTIDSNILRKNENSQNRDL